MFDESLESADITPVHKKGDATDKQNYCPVSVLPVVSLKALSKNRLDNIWKHF